MSSRHSLQEKRQVYDLLAKLLSAMKALAYAEIHKLQEHRSGQKNRLLCYRRAIGALLACGATLPAPKLSPLLIVIGTERGFCGDINRRIYTSFQSRLSENTDAGLVFVGERLFKHHDDGEFLAKISGAVVVEDVEPLVTQLMEVILQSMDRYSLINSKIVLLDDVSNEIIVFPVFGDEDNGFESLVNKNKYEPLVYEDPALILEKLLPEYFFAILQFCIKSALMSENRQRLTHMQQATKHLDEKRRHMAIKSNQLRKEKIIEEIVVSLNNE